VRNGSVTVRATKVSISTQGLKPIQAPAPCELDFLKPPDLMPVEQHRHHGKRRVRRIGLPERHGHLQAQFVGGLDASGQLAQRRDLAKAEA
jgi:hypothetical protein